MWVTEYGLLLNEERHPVLVKERSTAYDASGKISCQDDVIRILKVCFRADERAEEYMFLLTVNNRNELTAVFNVAHGQADSCHVSTRDIFSRALAAGATGIFIAHNHPSGDPSPSEADSAFTWKVKEAGELIGIPLIDSLVIGRNGAYYSFNASGLL